MKDIFNRCLQYLPRYRSPSRRTADSAGRLYVLYNNFRPTYAWGTEMPSASLSKTTRTANTVQFWKHEMLRPYLTLSLTIAAVAALGSACFANPELQEPSSIASEISVVQDLNVTLLRDLANSVKPDASGAIGQNQASFDQVQLQNQSSFVILDAIVERNTSQLDKALRILEYGFAHQRSDGSFDYEDARPGGAHIGAAPIPLTIDASAAFFYYDLGLSLTLLDQSEWFAKSPQTQSYRARVDAIKKHSIKGLSWLLSQERVLRTDHLADNRAFAYAMSYYLAGKALDDQAAMKVGISFLVDALKQQASDGTFPELNGFDSSYQGVSLYHAQVLYLALDSRQEPLRRELWSSIRRGMAKELTAVTADGTILTAGNSRIHPMGETVFGHTKQVDGRSATLALQYYARLAGNKSVQHQADSVAQHYYLLIH